MAKIVKFLPGLFAVAVLGLSACGSNEPAPNTTSEYTPSTSKSDPKSDPTSSSSIAPISSGTSNSSSEHRHTYSNEWTYDETFHWREPTCGDTEEVADKAEHIMDDGVITTEPTCKEKGVKTYSCTVCDYSYTEEVELADHSYESKLAFDEENHWTACKTCDEKFNPAPHDMYDAGTTTLYEDGYSREYQIEKCSYCDYLVKTHIHTYDDTWVDVGEEGHAHPANCGHNVTSESEEHVYHEWDSYYDEEGNFIQVCATCGHISKTAPSADDYVSEDGFLYHLEGGKVHITGLTEEAKTKKFLTIPSEIDGKAVEAIDDNADFRGIKVAALTFEEGIEYIGFNSLQKIEWFSGHGDIILPDSLIVCQSLPNISSNLRLGKNLLVFSNNNSNNYYLNELTIASTNIESFSGYHFSPKKVVVEEGVIKLPSNIFFSDESGIEEVVLPSTILSVANNFRSLKSELYLREGKVSYLKAGSNEHAIAVDTHYDEYEETITFHNDTRIIASGACSDIYYDYGAVKWVLPDNLEVFDDSTNYPYSRLDYNILLDDLNYDSVGGGYYLGSANNPYLLLVDHSNPLELTIHENCRVIGPNALNGFEKKINFNSKLVSVCYSGLDGIKVDYELSLPESIKFMANSAFSVDGSSTGKVILGKNITCLNNSFGLIKCDLEYGDIDYIYQFPFVDKDLTLPEGMKYAYLTGSINKLYVPSSIRYLSIGSTNGIKELHYDGTLEEYASIPKFDDSYSTGTAWINRLYVNNDQLVTNLDLSTGFTHIARGGLFAISSIRELVMPSEDVALDKYGIGYYRNLEKLQLTSSLEEFLTASLDQVSRNDEWRLFDKDGNEITKIEVDKNFKASTSIYNCASITEVVLKEDCTNYSFTGLFRYLPNLTKATIKDGVTYIPDGFLYGCEGITSITLPDSVTDIDDSAFENCVNLETINLPASLEHIDRKAFKNDAKLVMPVVFNDIDHFIDIDYEAFYGTGVTSVNLSNATIGSYAFANAKSLTSVLLGSKVTRVGSQAFSNNSPSIICRSYTVKDDFNYSNYASDWYTNPFPAITHYAGYITDQAGKRDESTYDYANKYTAQYYLTQDNKGNITGAYLYYFSNNSAADAVSEITIDQCYETYSSLKKVSYTVKGICPNAFEKGNTKVTKVTIGSKVVNLAPGALSGLSRLQNLIIESDVTNVVSLFNDEAKVGYYSAGPSGSNYIPKTLLEVELYGTDLTDDALYGARSIKTLILNNGTESISTSTNSFKNTDIRVIHYDTNSYMSASAITPGSTSYNGIAKNAEYVYRNDDANEAPFSYVLDQDRDSFIIRVNSDGKDSIVQFIRDSDYVFIENIIIDENGTGRLIFSIEPYAFEGCVNLVNVKIESNLLESIGAYAFKNCTSLKSITIPSNVTSIGGGAFNGSLLFRVYFQGGYKITTNDPFYDSRLIEVVTGDINDLPSDMRDKYKYASSLSTSKVVFHDDGSVSYEDTLYYAPECDVLTMPEGVTKIYKIEVLTENPHNQIIFRDDFDFSTLYSTDFEPVRKMMLETVDEYGVIYLGNEDNPYQILYSAAGLTEESYSINNKCISIYAKAFCDNTDIETIVIPNGVRYINRMAFDGCSNLKDITISDSVVLIDYEAFCYCSKLTEITLPTNAVLGQDILLGCSGLKKLTYSGTVASYYLSYQALDVEEVVFTGNSIVSEAWSYRGELKKITFTAENTVINSKAFSNCGGLTSLVIPENIIYLGKFAFSHCNGLVSVVIPETLTSLDSQVFAECENLKEVTVPGTAAIFTSGLFDDCKAIEKITLTSLETGHYLQQLFASSYLANKNLPISLKEVVLSEGIAALDNMLLTRAENVEKVTLPSTLETIGEQAFYGCTSLKSIVIPDKVETINSLTFSNCTALTSVVLGEGVTTIDTNAFYDCTSLEKIYFPSSLSSVGEYAFYHCNALSEVYYGGTIGEWGTISYANANANPLSTGNVKLYLLDENGDVEFADNKFSLFTRTVLNEEDFAGVTALKSYAYVGLGLTEVHIPDTVTSMGKYLFQNNTTMVTLELPYLGSSLEKDYYFTGMDELFKDDIIPATLTNVTIRGGYLINKAFVTNNNVKNLVLGDDVIFTHIDGYMYYEDFISRLCLSGCQHIEKITLNVDKLGSLSYSDNYYRLSTLFSKTSGTPSTLTEVVATGNKIPARVFQNSSSVNKITLLGKFESIGGSAFTGTSITTITIPASVTKIDSFAFFDADSLVSVIFEEGSNLEVIASNAFTACDVLAEIEIPGSVVELASDAFEYCPNLTSIYFDDTETGARYIKTATNNYHTLVSVDKSIDSFTFNKNTLGIGNNAFYNCKNITSITIPNTIRSIDASAFEGCSNLASVTFEDGIQLSSIPALAFGNCTKLTSVIIPEGVTSIGDNAFGGCSLLENIYLPSTLESMYTSALKNHKSGINIYFKGDLGDWVSLTLTDSSYNNYNGNANIYYYDGSDYALIGSDLVIPGKVTSINDMTLGQLDIDTLVISEGVESIGKYAFAGAKMTEVTLPSSLTHIGMNAFDNCSSLVDVYYNGTIQNWLGIYFDSPTSNPMYYATYFYILDENGDVNHNGQKYSLLRDLVIPEGTTSINGYAFYSFECLYSVTIPSTLATVNNAAFYECTGIVQVVNNNSQLQNLGDNTKNGYIAYYAVTHDHVSRIYHDTDSGFVYHIYSGLRTVLDYVGNDPDVVVPSEYNALNTLSIDKPLIESVKFTSTNQSVRVNEKAFGLHATGLRKISLTTVYNYTNGTSDPTFSKMMYPEVAKNLTEIELTSNVFQIKNGSLANLTSLEKITVPFVGTGSIGSGTSVRFVDIFNSVPSTLRTVVVAENPYSTKLGSYSFDGGASMVTSLTIPSTITQIDGYAFSGSNYTSINFAGTKEQWNNITKDVNWKSGCSSLTQIVCTDETVSV